LALDKHPRPKRTVAEDTKNAVSATLRANRQMRRGIRAGKQMMEGVQLTLDRVRLVAVDLVRTIGKTSEKSRLSLNKIRASQKQLLKPGTGLPNFQTETEVVANTTREVRKVVNSPAVIRRGTAGRLAKETTRVAEMFRNAVNDVNDDAQALRGEALNITRQFNRKIDYMQLQFSAGAMAARDLKESVEEYVPIFPAVIGRALLNYFEEMDAKVTSMISRTKAISEKVKVTTNKLRRKMTKAADVQ